MKERIRQLMEQLNLNQQEFSKKIRVSSASISNILAGRSNPTHNHVMAIHAALPEVNVSLRQPCVMIGSSRIKHLYTSPHPLAQLQRLTDDHTDMILLMSLIKRAIAGDNLCLDVISQLTSYSTHFLSSRTTPS